MENNQPHISTAECAAMLLETLPQVMRMFGGAMRQAHGDDEINISQIRTLAMLHHGPWLLSDLARRHHVKISTMSHAITVLEGRKWVARTDDPHDRRKVLVSLTENGITAHAHFTERAQTIIAELIEQIDDADRIRLMDGLNVLQRVARSANNCPPENKGDPV
jgi:DNA-binding MarR family transcriptional regulator